MTGRRVADMIREPVEPQSTPGRGRRWLVTVGSLVIGALAGCQMSSPGPSAVAMGEPAGEPPPRGGYDDIELLSPTATLPTVAECQARIRASGWEPRRQNADENRDSTDLTLATGVDGVDSAKQSFYLDRIAAVNAADIAGTTDQLIQFFSCYWGIDDQSTRARAFIESSWDQDLNGDFYCNEEAVSWGLLQIKNQTPRGCTPPGHDHTYPDVFVSTGNNLNYALAWVAACYRGDMSAWIPADFMNDESRRMRECVGLWFSGQWRRANEDYLARYDEALQTEPWLYVDFPVWEVDSVCREPACDRLPSDDDEVGS